MEIKEEVVTTRTGHEIIGGNLWLQYFENGRGESVSILDGPPGIGYCMTIPRQDIRNLAFRLMQLADQLGIEAN